MICDAHCHFFSNRFLQTLTKDTPLAELGTAEVTNGDPETGIVDVPGGRLAVVRVPDGNYLGLSQRTG